MNKLLFILFFNFISTSNIKVALAQMCVVPNRPEENVAKMLDMIYQAKLCCVDVIVFPELCIGGYFIGDKWLDNDYCKYLMTFNKQIKKASEGVIVIFGNVYIDTHGKNYDGTARKYNAAYIYQNQKKVNRMLEFEFVPKGMQPKTLLPNYRMFDDKRYFSSMIDISLESGERLDMLIQPFYVKINNQYFKIGLQICEDLWFENYKYNNNYLNVAKFLVKNGADLIVNISASPWNYGKNDERLRNIELLKKELQSDFKPLVYVNQVGVQNNGKNIITFDGKSAVFNSCANQISRDVKSFKEDLIIVDDLYQDSLYKTTVESKIYQKYRAIKNGLKHLKYITDSRGDLKFVIGLSGGIDSAVVLALLTKVTGPNNITAINMPTKFNSTKTRDCAKQIANSLGVKFITLPIEDISELNKKILETFDDKSNVGSIILNNENIMAKVRGTVILSNYAQRHNALLVNNGNKLEIALGYATLYGDINGVVAPIGDLTKVEVFELAKFLNDVIFKKEIIPAELIPDEFYQFGCGQIAPSAELKSNQVDPMKWGYHDALIEKLFDFTGVNFEKIVEWYNVGLLANKLNISHKYFEIYNLNDPAIFKQDLSWLKAQINKSVFKRIQAPPIIITSSTAFGFDLRESQIN